MNRPPTWLNPQQPADPPPINWMRRPTTDAGLAPGLAKKMAARGYETLADLDAASDEELLMVSGFGATTLATVRRALASWRG